MRTAVPVFSILTAMLPAQTTWVVANTPAPGVHFTSLPAAVAAAASGDTLLVAGGVYQPFQVSGKALSILGAGSSATFVQQPSTYPSPYYVRVDAVPPGRTFRVTGMRIQNPSSTLWDAQLMITGSGSAVSGTTVLSDVVVTPATGNGQHGAGLAVYSANALAGYSEFGGSWDSAPFLYWGSPGVIVDYDARFVADSCLMIGGSVPTGTIILPPFGAIGGDAVAVGNAVCRITRSTAIGGDAPANATSATGGAGIAGYGTAAVVIAGSSTSVLQGGAAGPSTSSTGGSGVFTDGTASASVYGPVSLLGGMGAGGPAPATSGSNITVGLPARPELTLSGAWAAGGALLATQSVGISVDHGPPNQLFLLLLDLAPAYVPLAGLSDEPLLLTPSALIVTFGVLDGTGHWNTSFVPAIATPSWVAAATALHWQAFAFDPVTARFAGSNSEIRGFQP